MISEWNITVAGAVLCLIFSWFLGIVSRSQGIQFGKTGLVVGIVGVMVLVGMAAVSPLRASKKRTVSMPTLYTLDGYPRAQVGVANYARILSVTARAMQEVGPRPSKNHLAFEFPNGDLKWVTKLRYVELIENRTDD